jgi:hypothetical protein
MSRYVREMKPVFKTNMEPTEVSADVCHDAFKTIENPVYRDYFQELFRTVWKDFQLENRNFSIVVNSKPTEETTITLSKVALPVQNLPEIVFNPPTGIKLIGQVFETKKERYYITFRYRCKRIRRNRSSSPPSRGRSPPSRDRSPHRSSSSPSLPPRRHQSRRPRSPSPRGWSIFG